MSFQARWPMLSQFRLGIGHARIEGIASRMRAMRLLTPSRVLSAGENLFEHKLVLAEDGLCKMELSPASHLGVSQRG